jgi:hypothetical protein
MFKNKGFRVLVVLGVLLALTSISCGVSSLPFMATETPTPTTTFTPSPTSTPSSTPTPTLTPTTTPLPTGVQTEEQADGSTRFNDFDNLYRLILPAEWVVIPFDQDELGMLVDELSKDNPKFEDAAAAFKNLDPDVFRLVALNQNKKYFESGAVPNLNITAIENDVMSAMPLSFVTGALEESFKQNGTKVVSAGVNTIDNSNGVEIEYLDIEQEANGIEIAQRLLIFQSNGKLILVTLTAPIDFRANVFASGDVIGASIEFLK